MIKELKAKIRQVTDEDKKILPVFSYSKMEVFKNCPYQYNLKYNEKKYTSDTSLALELGSLCHYVLEQKGKMLTKNSFLDLDDYIELNGILAYGVNEVDEKTKEYIPGVSDLSKKYFEQWYEPDNASGKTYVDKMCIFEKVLNTEMEENDGWVPILFEHHFEFVYDNRVIIQGFIDRVDKKGDDYRTVDYKTSKKVYDKSKLATSLQFGIYALDILLEFGSIPVESIYRFILIDDKQYALTKGWEKRLIKALDKVFDDIENNEKVGIWVPKPTPLCHWCNYCSHNPDAHEYKNECEYYSLWTPTNKTFAINQQWNALKIAKDKTNLDNKRKLIF